MTDVEKLKVGTRVEVEWTDSVHRFGWAAKTEYLEFSRDVEKAIYLSCGYVLRQSKRSLTLIQSCSHYKNSAPTVDNAICIPNVAITKISKLGAKEKRT